MFVKTDYWEMYVPKCATCVLCGPYLGRGGDLITKMCFVSLPNMIIYSYNEITGHRCNGGGELI